MTKTELALRLYAMSDAEPMGSYRAAYVAGELHDLLSSTDKARVAAAMSLSEIVRVAPLAKLHAQQAKCNRACALGNKILRNSFVPSYMAVDQRKARELDKALNLEVAKRIKSLNADLRALKKALAS